MKSMKLRQAKKIVKSFQNGGKRHRLSTFLRAGERYAKWYRRYT